MDPHENIFYYYRGPTRVNESEKQFDRQLENNTTKALINLLYYSSEKALPQFVQLINSKLSNYTLPIKQGSAYRFSLQRMPELCKTASNKVLITICGDPSSDSGEGKGGKPDAWIYIPDSMAIMIETKLGGLPSEAQIEGHLKEATWNRISTNRCNLSWSEIYESLSEDNDFLIRQFKQYLEVIGMTPFKGFVEDDFNFFLSFDNDYKRLIRSKLQQFGQLVMQNIPKEMRTAYPDLKVPRIYRKREIASVDLRKQEDDSDPFNNCNPCITLNSEKLGCVGVIQGGRYRDKNKAIGRFYSKISNEPNELKSQLTNLGNGFYIEIFSIVPLYGGNAGLGINKWESKAKLHLDFVNDAMIKYIIQLLKDIHLPGLHIGKEIVRNDPAVKDKELLVDKACSIFEKLYPIICYVIN
ncbi:MAG: hypothetical protein ABSF74_09635 [Dehalococcoidia bacterium]|jgi:hypothetical protein